MRVAEILAAGFALCVLTAAAQPPDTSAPSPEQLVRGALEAARELESYSCTFLKRERRGDKLSPEFAYKVDFLKNPRCILWRQVSGPGNKRTTLYNRSIAPEHIYTDPVLPLFGPLRLKTSSPWVRRECGRSLLEFGLENFAGRLKEAFESTRSAAGHRWRVFGRSRVGARRFAPAWILRQEKSDGALVDWFIDVETGLAVKVFVLDESGALLEEYVFADIERSREFDRDHFAPRRIWPGTEREKK